MQTGLRLRFKVSFLLLFNEYLSIILKLEFLENCTSLVGTEVLAFVLPAFQILTEITKMAVRLRLRAPL